MTDDELLRDLRNYVAARSVKLMRESRENAVETNIIARIDARLAGRAAGCYCKNYCMAPIVMGRQAPCLRIPPLPKKG